MMALRLVVIRSAFSDESGAECTMAWPAQASSGRSGYLLADSSKQTAMSEAGKAYLSDRARRALIPALSYGKAFAEARSRLW
jgi:hypothetical protein